MKSTYCPSTRKNPYALATIGLLCFLLSLAIPLTGCESHERAADEAFQKVKSAKSDSMDSTASSNVGEQITPAASRSQERSLEYRDPMARFKSKIERKLQENEAMILRLKGLPNNGKLIKRVIGLEKENADIRTKIAQYASEEKARWEAFQATIELDVSTLSTQLRELGIVPVPQK